MESSAPSGIDFPVIFTSLLTVKILGSTIIVVIAESLHRLK